nr:SPFH domain-containing protein [Salsipaludibacter albus]
MIWPFAIAAIVILGIVFLGLAVKIVRPYQRGLVERLGRYKTTKDPGFNLIIPFIETIQLIDMREQVVDVPPQEVITEDNVVVSVDAVVYYEATDPKRLVYNVADFYNAIIKLAQTNLRNLIGDLELDRALTSRDTINTRLRDVLDVATDKWGVRVVRVEIQRIDPPPEVVSAMHAQMRAERDRRATVTEANGYREAAIARANGEKEAAVLAAEGRKQAAVLDAEGDARAIELRADAEKLRLARVGEGEGEAALARLTGIKEAGADQAVLTVEYLSALEEIGDGRAGGFRSPIRPRAWRTCRHHVTCREEGRRPAGRVVPRPGRWRAPAVVGRAGLDRRPRCPAASWGRGPGGDGRRGAGGSGRGRQPGGAAGRRECVVRGRAPGHPGHHDRGAQGRPQRGGPRDRRRPRAGPRRPAADRTADQPVRDQPAPLDQDRRGRRVRAAGALVRPAGGLACQHDGVDRGPRGLGAGRLGHDRRRARPSTGLSDARAILAVDCAAC